MVTPISLFSNYKISSFVRPLLLSAQTTLWTLNSQTSQRTKTSLASSRVFGAFTLTLKTTNFSWKVTTQQSSSIAWIMNSTKHGTFQRIRSHLNILIQDADLGTKINLRRNIRPIRMFISMPVGVSVWQIAYPCGVETNRPTMEHTA